MCGIAGIVSTDTAMVNGFVLAKMAESLRHRGPDGQATWVDVTGCAGLAHRRLAIIDLSTAGAQPMHYMDRYTIVYNGEIYNYLELKKSLAGRGFHFVSDSDTEVILAAFACYGEACLQHFDGMFSFAIWDAVSQQLFAARDRFGEKPFYYAVNDTRDRFIFASEMKAIWAAGTARDMDLTMMLNYITLGQVQDPTDKSRTFYHGLQSLAPAHLLHYDHRNKTLAVARYYTLERKQRSGIADTAEFSELFRHAVSLRLRSDVAVGTSLSGGLDSSSIVAMIMQVQGSQALPTFSAVFPGFDKDESDYVKRLNERYPLRTHFVTPDANGMVRDFERLCHHQEEPFPSSSIYAQFKVFELARQSDVTVLLDGQGADEILAGYPRHLHWYLQQLFAQGRFGLLKQEFGALRAHQLQINFNWKNYVAALSPGFTARQLQRRAIDKQRHHRDLTTGFIAGNINEITQRRPVIRTLADMLSYSVEQFGLEELLRFADRNSMAHGREVRLPFLDHRLAAFCINAPDAAKVSNGFTKRVLRDSMNAMLPREITWRTDKTGYEPPQASWMTDARLRDYVHEAKRHLVAARILRPNVLETNHKPLPAHAADNFEWRYLVAANFLDAR